MEVKKFIKKNAPTIAVVGGVIGTVCAGVWGCKKTVKMLEVKEQTKLALEEANAKLSNVNPEYPDYDEKANRKEVTKIYGRAALETVKVYAGPVILGIGSITAILGGHKIIQNRYAVTSACLATTEAAFEKYRERVKDKYGEKVEDEIYHNVETVEVEEEDKNGKVKKKKKKVFRGNPFDVEFSTITAPGYAVGDLEHDKMLVQNTAKLYSETLRAKPGNIILLYDVLKCLGLNLDENDDLVKSSRVIGWKNDPSDEERDCSIEITCFEVVDIHGNPCLKLSFNVDGRVITW